MALRVHDTGRGIAADRLAEIFEPFVQVDRRRLVDDRGWGGVGLGLAISRNLARGMGGDVAVESTPGAGSVFMVQLPAATGARAPGAAHDAPNAARQAVG